MHPLSHEFMALFTGWNKNYGTYKLTGEITETGKRMGKAYSLKGDVTPELWSAHLLGTQGLGIIPITDKSEVMFGAIDIDDYGLDIMSLNKEIQNLKFPLTLCRTKSGGAHLYIFFSAWVPAKVAQLKLREMAAILGFGSAEVFPKQTTILASRGDVGQWINMPYFLADGTERYALNEQNLPITATQFIKYAGSRRLDAEQLVSIETKVSNELIPDGPPCLNHLATSGFPMGTRNNGLFNLGVYCQKAFPDSWKEHLAEMNQKFMDPPVSQTELSGVLKSLIKGKQYQYTCKSPPILNFCNVNRCRARKHGIGFMGVGMPMLGTLTKIDTSPPIWFVDVEGGGRVELDTTELQFIRNYQTKCLATCNVAPPLLKQEIWIEVIQRLLEELTIVEIPVDATPKGILHSLLEEFCTSRVSGRSHDELLLGKPWTCDGKHYFRMRDFIDFLERRRFKSFELNRIAVYLKDWGAKHHFFNIKGRGCNCYSIPEFKKAPDGFEVPQEIIEKGNI